MENGDSAVQVSNASGAPDAPTQVFEQFLQALVSAGVADELVTRLRKVILQDKVFTERALKEALFGEVPTL